MNIVFEFVNRISYLMLFRPCIQLWQENNTKPPLNLFFYLTNNLLFLCNTILLFLSSLCLTQSIFLYALRISAIIIT